jgi:hypothetical protein
MPQSRRRLPRVIPFMVRHAMLGFAIAALFVGGLLAFDIGGFAALLQGAPWATRIMATALLWFMTGLTFASAQMGFALMALSDDSRETGGWRRFLGRLLDRLLRPSPVAAPAVVPVPVRVASADRRRRRR